MGQAVRHKAEVPWCQVSRQSPQNSPNLDFKTFSKCSSPLGEWTLMLDMKLEKIVLRNRRVLNCWLLHLLPMFLFPFDVFWTIVDFTFQNNVSSCQLPCFRPKIRCVKRSDPISNKYPYEYLRIFWLHQMCLQISTDIRFPFIRYIDVHTFTCYII